MSDRSAPSVATPPPDPSRSWAAPVGDTEIDVAVLRAEILHLRRALCTRTSIDHAVGMLMMRFGIDDARAFDLLTRWSMNSNVKLRDIAGAMHYLVLADGDHAVTAPAPELLAWVTEQLRARADT